MYGAIVFIWIITPVYETIVGSLSTDIVKGTCVPWGVYSSFAAEKIIASSLLLSTYLMPLMIMVFCYSRIVYALKHKVKVAVTFLISLISTEKQSYMVMEDLRGWLGNGVLIIAVPRVRHVLQHH